MNNRELGVIGEMIVSEYLISMGFNVSFPKLDKGYDCIIEKDGFCQRVQIKTVRSINNKAVFDFRRKDKSRYTDCADLFIGLDYTNSKLYCFDIFTTRITINEENSEEYDLEKNLKKFWK